MKDPKKSSPLDILVMGSGPAGLSIAAACAKQGLSVAVISPNKKCPWPRHYGVWTDELKDPGQRALLTNIWSEVEVKFSQKTQTLHREYGLLSGAQLQHHLSDVCKLHRVQFVQEAVAEVGHKDHQSFVVLCWGRRLFAALVIDATGHWTSFTQKGSSRLFQSAYGVVFHSPASKKEDRGPATLMDFSPADRPAGRSHIPPTFLYALPLSGGRMFWEETVLVGGRLSSNGLQRCLEGRLQRKGVDLSQVEEAEHCLIPMDAPVPNLKQRLAAFGGAASMVHPATGYMVAKVLAEAPRMGEVIAKALEGGVEGAALSKVYWEALWPSDSRRCHALYVFGTRFLATQDQKVMERFFETFFSLPRAEWSGFLSRTLRSPKLIQVMAYFFRRSPMGIRGRLIRHTLTWPLGHFRQP